MTIAQRRTSLTTRFSERMPVDKRRMTVKCDVDGVHTQFLVLSIDCSNLFFQGIAIKVESEGERTLTTSQLSTCKDNALAVISLHFSYHSIDTLYVHLILYLETLTATVYS
jgi:hypothetical protein